MDLFNLSKKKMNVYVNNQQVKFIGIVDIIIEADKPLIIQILREDTKTLEVVVDEYEPYEAELFNDRLEMKTYTGKKKELSRKKGA